MREIPPMHKKGEEAVKKVPKKFRLFLGIACVKTRVDRGDITFLHPFKTGEIAIMFGDDQDTNAHTNAAAIPRCSAAL